MAQAVNVYVVDDDQSVCQSLTMFLRSAGFNARSFSCANDLMRECNELPAGCMLLDVRMPDVDGFGILGMLGGVKDRLAIIVMTGHGDVATAVRAMRAGAVDFVEKPFEEGLILRAIARAAESLEHKIRLLDRRTQAVARLGVLTARERDVLTGMIDGRPNKVLAYDLGISVRTVEMHRANLMDRLDATSAAQVIRLAFDAGLIDRRTGFPSILATAHAA